jgi:hypothetical protein
MKKSLLFLLMFSICFAQEIGARYLIITHDNFYSAIQPLAEWKHRKGLRTKVVKLSDIGSSASQIRTYIENAYNTWQIRPEFLLLVGAPNYLPFSSIGYVYSDNYYTNMDGDIYNEILSGRLTVHSTTEAQAVVNKILLYEKTPSVDTSNWLINACLIVREGYDHDDSIYWSDINHVKNLMRSHGYNTIDTLSRSGNSNSSDVISAVNDGRAFVLYRGNGSNNWYYPFDVNPDQAQNGVRVPIVLSITCQTIGTGQTPAVAERWLLTGGSSQPKGAAGYFATTTSGNGIAHLRSAVCTGFFNALFQEGKNTFGQACEGGRRNVYILYGSSSEYRGYTTLGDPEMNIWTAMPESLVVLYDSVLSVDDDSLIVRVECSSVTMESTLVCVVLDSTVYEYGHIVGTGEVCFHFNSLHSGTMDITATAPNRIPYLGSISIMPSHVDERTQQNRVFVSDMCISPNPFSKLTQISFEVDSRQKSVASIKIYDLSGGMVKSFGFLPYAQGATQITWDGTDNAGQDLPSGVYFAHFASGAATKIRSIVLLR